MVWLRLLCFNLSIGWGFSRKNINGKGGISNLVPIASFLYKRKEKKLKLFGEEVGDY